jgi:hypothetical protein
MTFKSQTTGSHRNTPSPIPKKVTRERFDTYSNTLNFKGIFIIVNVEI